MFAELCRVFLDFRRADQELERAAEPASPAGEDQIVDATLDRAHFHKGNLAITGHFSSYCLAAPQSPPALSAAEEIEGAASL